MNNNTVVDMREFVEAKNGKAFTTSQRVAEAFGKQHHHVMQKLDALDCSEQFLTSNFSRVNFKHRGNTYQACEMTKDGFMFLVMGFTGKKAAAIKEGYIAAFNWMAEQLGINAEEAVGSLLGAAELATLRAVMQDKAKAVDPDKRISLLHTMHHRLHARFGVPRTEMIKREDFADACNFIAAYALEGEWISSSQSGAGMQLSEREVRALYLMMSHYYHAEQWAMKAGVYAIARVIESRPLMTFHEHFRDIGIGFRTLDERRSEIYRVYSSKGLRGGYAAGVAA